jgi:hypothetical protein
MSSDAVASRTLPHKVPQGELSATIMATAGLSNPQADMKVDGLIVSLKVVGERVWPGQWVQDMNQGCGLRNRLDQSGALRNKIKIVMYYIGMCRHTIKTLVLISRTLGGGKAMTVALL